jgi:hypothetical protein
MSNSGMLPASAMVGRSTPATRLPEVTASERSLPDSRSGVPWVESKNWKSSSPENISGSDIIDVR